MDFGSMEIGLLIWQIVLFVFYGAFFGIIFYTLFLVIKALKKYLRE